jgi:DNA helicase-2/ATP-dependent DNA helicase PcrA
MPGLTMNSWEKKRVIDQLKLPSGIVGDGLTVESDASEEERRLFFVGVTRAKHELYLSFPMSVDGKSMLRSIFTQETEMEPIIVNDVDLSQVVANILARDVTLGETITFEEEQYIHEFLSTYKLSATDLNKFLADPLVFLRDTIFRYPFEENEHTIFGKTYHKALEIFYATFKNTGETPVLSWLTSQFQVLLSREILPFELREKLLEK